MRPYHRDHTVKGPRGTAALQELRSALQRVKAREEAAAEEHAAELRSQLALQRADHEGQVPGPPARGPRTEQQAPLLGWGSGRTTRAMAGLLS
jgi:hypothetical protein